MDVAIYVYTYVNAISACGINDIEWIVMVTYYIPTLYFNLSAYDVYYHQPTLFTVNGYDKTVVTFYILGEL